MSDQVCPYCNRPLMKIDYYGEVLAGCIDCNRWGHPGDEKLIMELMDSDLEARASSNHDTVGGELWSEFTEEGVVHKIAFPLQEVQSRVTSLMAINNSERAGEE